jgi:hypothetical protein
MNRTTEGKIILSPTVNIQSTDDLGRYIVEGNRWKVTTEYTIDNNYGIIPIGTILSTHGYLADKISFSCSLGGGSISVEDIINHCEYLYLDKEDPTYIEHKEYCDDLYNKMRARHKKILSAELCAQAKMINMDPTIIDSILKDF